MDRLRRAAGTLPGLVARNQKPLRFLVAGGINTLFGLSIYPLLLLSFATLHRRYLLALAIAQAISLVFAYLVYKVGVFRTQANVAREFGAFASFYLANYAANWIALPLLVEAANIPPIYAQLGFSLILIIGGWFWHSRVTFRNDGLRR